MCDANFDFIDIDFYDTEFIDVGIPDDDITDIKFNVTDIPPIKKKIYLSLIDVIRKPIIMLKYNHIQKKYAIKRYLQKRKKRSCIKNKQIYKIRHVYAINRYRIKGRFVKK